MVNTFKVIVSGFVKNSDGRLLVIRRSDDEESFPGMLAIPGGTIEAEETSLLELDTVENNLEREIKEETNINARVLNWLESTAMVKDGQGKLYLFFECQLVNDLNQTATSSETPEVFWADIESLDIDQCTPTLKKYVQNTINAT